MYNVIKQTSQVILFFLLSFSYSSRHIQYTCKQWDSIYHKKATQCSRSTRETSFFQGTKVCECKIHIRKRKKYKSSLIGCIHQSCKKGKIEMKLHDIYVEGGWDIKNNSKVEIFISSRKKSYFFGRELMFTEDRVSSE